MNTNGHPTANPSPGPNAGPDQSPGSGQPGQPPTLLATPLTAELLRGALDVEHTAGGGVLPHRLPAWARAQVADPQLAMAESQPSGVRLVFRTRATVVELDVTATKRAYVGVPPRPDGLYDLRVDGRTAGQGSVTGGNLLTIDMSAGTAEYQQGPPGTLRFEGLPDTDKDVEVWLPHNEATELLALRTDAPSAPHLSGARRCGCITEARSARAPTRPVPPRRGPHSPPRPAAWTW